MSKFFGCQSIHRRWKGSKIPTRTCTEYDRNVSRTWQVTVYMGHMCKYMIDILNCSKLILLPTLTILHISVHNRVLLLFKRICYFSIENAFKSSHDMENWKGSSKSPSIEVLQCTLEWPMLWCIIINSNIDKLLTQLRYTYINE